MKLTRSLQWAVAALLLGLLGGCATPAKLDYSAFRESRPASILVLPPLNGTPEVGASPSMLAQATLPLAESGYYVLPVALVDETFRHNGLDTPGEIHQVDPARLRQIFGADAALYIEITQYGTTYVVIASETRVTAAARLVDLRDGRTLWTGTATASSNEGGNNSGGLGALLVKALLTQILDTVSNRGHAIAGITSQRLLAAGRPNGLLYGPRSPLYLKDGSPAP